MTTVAFASARHSPGVTTTLMAMAAAWPANRRVVVLEVDAAGSDLLCRYGLMAEPNLLTLAADGRTEVSADSLWANTQHLVGQPGVEVVVGPLDPRQAQAAITALVQADLTRTLAELDADVLLDVGRLGPDSPALELFAAADVAAMVARPTLAQAAHLHQRIAWLDRSMELVVIGEGQWGPEELAANVGASGVLAALPDDHRGAESVFAAGRGARALRRSGLWRSAHALVEQVMARAAAPRSAATAWEPTPQAWIPPERHTGQLGAALSGSNGGARWR